LLNAKIGLAYNVADKFYSFIDDHIEVATLKEALARNSHNFIRESKQK
jgi:hypothetical protein